MPLDSIDSSVTAARLRVFLLSLVLGGTALNAQTSFGQQAEAFTKTKPVSTELKPKVAEGVKVVGTKAGEWPHWRGPNFDGTSPATGLPEKWSPQGENILWQSEELATRSTPVAINGKLYLLARDQPRTNQEGEQVICAEAETGKILWRYRFNVFLSDVPDTRVAWSCVAADPTSNNVYALGVGGLFTCLRGDTGEVVWQRSLSEQFGLLTTYGGRTNMPLIFEDLVIISGITINWGEFAKPEHRFLGLDKLTGEVVWFGGTKPFPYDTTYSAAVACVLDGQAAIVFGAGDGAVYAMQPRTGKVIWRYQLSLRGLNCTPLVVDDVVYIGQTEENIEDNSMGAIVAIDGTGSGDITETGTIWKIKESQMGRSTPVLVDGILYCALDTGKLLPVDAKTGKPLRLSRRNEILGTIQRASLLHADDKLFVAESNGRFHVFKLDSDQPGKVTKTLSPRGLTVDGQIYGSPLVAYGRLYVPTTETLYCIGTGQAQDGGLPAKSLPTEMPLTDRTPAHVQVLPAESLLRSGKSQQYRARLFNAAGQLLREAKAEELTWSITEGGKIDANGLATVQSDKPLGVRVTAKLKQPGADQALQGLGRIRLFPALPWQYTFEDGVIPEPWIGIRYRHQVRKVDGNNLIVKVTTIPKGTRSQGWIGPDDLSNYTVQADVKGSSEGVRLPDVGLTAQRYRMDLLGASQVLKIYSWVSHEIKYTEQPFSWKPEVWYTMKFQASLSTNEDGKPMAVFRGKVWPREEKEPSEWTIQRNDLRPDTVGSPGLFGNATDAELFIDNIRVYPNDAGPAAQAGKAATNDRPKPLGQ